MSTSCAAKCAPKRKQHSLVIYELLACT